MQDSARQLDDLDRSILHALQIAPRAPWTEVGAVLGVDPVTVRRRWDRLHETGGAWTTCYPGLRLADSVCMAFIEIDVQSGQQVAVGRELATYPQVITVEHMAGGRDLMVTVVISSLNALSDLVTERISRLPGVVRTRAALATGLFAEGSDWRLRALTPARQRMLTRPAISDPGPSALGDPERKLITALSRNGRAPAVELARETGLNAPGVRRRLATMMHNNELSLRCEVARDLTEWPIMTSLWASVPPGRLDKAVQSLRGLPELRLLASVTGAQNLLFTVWLKSVADVGRLEALIGDRLPELQLTDRAVVLRQVKRAGWLLDENGHATDCVPIDPWLPPSRLPAA